VWCRQTREREPKQTQKKMTTRLVGSSDRLARHFVFRVWVLR
jgi:hypothetical protein